MPARTSPSASMHWLGECKLLSSRAVYFGATCWCACVPEFRLTRLACAILLLSPGFLLSSLALCLSCLPHGISTFHVKTYIGWMYVWLSLLHQLQPAKEQCVSLSLPDGDGHVWDRLSVPFAICSLRISVTSTPTN